ncbi:MAG: ferredoxin [Candidatus Kryptoniota bacterium]
MMSASGNEDGASSTPMKFVITDDCNGCGVCKSMAPDYFDCVEYAHYYIIGRQPITESEIELFRDVADYCTVNAIREVNTKM